MKYAIPQNDIVLCKGHDSSKKTTESGFIYTIEAVPTYEVIDVGPAVSKDINLKKGDIIRANTSGTPVNVEGEDLFMFKACNVAGKLVH